MRRALGYFEVEGEMKDVAACALTDIEVSILRLVLPHDPSFVPRALASCLFVTSRSAM